MLAWPELKIPPINLWTVWAIKPGLYPPKKQRRVVSRRETENRGLRLKKIIALR